MIDRRLEQALKHLEIAAELTPRNLRYRADLGQAYFAAGMWDAAAKEFAAASALGGGARVDALWSFALLRSGRNAQAGVVIDAALEHAGVFARGLYVRALCAYAGGDYDGCEADLGAAARLSPSDLYRDDLRDAAGGPTAARKPPAGLREPMPQSFLRWWLRDATMLERTSSGGAADGGAP